LLSVFLRDDGSSLGVHRVGTLGDRPLTDAGSRRVSALLASAALRRDAGVWVLESSGLSADLRGRGLGAELYADAIAVAGEHGAVLVAHANLVGGSTLPAALRVWRGRSLRAFPGVRLGELCAASDALFERA
jgi:GNAT superfamily N-acetyltransferase